MLENIISYGTETWNGILENKKHRNKILRTEKQILIRIAKAHRTVLNEALQVITGIPPLDLLLKERNMIMLSKNDRRKETLTIW